MAIATSEIAAPRFAVVARGVTRSFQDHQVLADVDLTIGTDEFVALLGRRGSGKSTLLRILGGLDSDYGGDVLVPETRSVVTLESPLIPWLRVLPNVVLGLAAGPSPRAGLRQQGLSALDEVGMGDHAQAWPDTLSAAEAHRVALARALIRRPDLVLLDDPFGALDGLARTRMQLLLQDLCTRHGPAVLLVTDDVDEAVLLADRVAVLVDGRIALDQAVGLDRPRRRGDPGFVARRDRFLAELAVQTRTAERA
jgi:sulfonate transport system ATP-binding protein